MYDDEQKEVFGKLLLIAKTFPIRLIRGSATRLLTMSELLRFAIFALIGQLIVIVQGSKIQPFFS